MCPDWCLSHWYQDYPRSLLDKEPLSLTYWTPVSYLDDDDYLRAGETLFYGFPFKTGLLGDITDQRRTRNNVLL